MATFYRVKKALTLFLVRLNSMSFYVSVVTLFCKVCFVKTFFKSSVCLSLFQFGKLRAQVDKLM